MTGLASQQGCGQFQPYQPGDLARMRAGDPGPGTHVFSSRAAGLRPETDLPTETLLQAAVVLMSKRFQPAASSMPASRARRGRSRDVKAALESSP